MNNVSMMCTLPSAETDWQKAARLSIGNASQLLAALAAQADLKYPGLTVLEIGSDFALDAASLQNASAPFNVSRGRTLALVGGEWGPLLCLAVACCAMNVLGHAMLCHSRACHAAAWGAFGMHARCSAWPACLVACSATACLLPQEAEAANLVQPSTCLAPTNFWFWSRVLRLCCLTSA